MDKFILWQTPAGNRFLLAPPPWSRTTLLLWEMARADWDWPEDVPVMSADAARSYLEAAEDAHDRHGFHVLPGWRGLRIPAACPAGVGLDLQSCFLCAAHIERGVSHG